MQGARQESESVRGALCSPVRVKHPASRALTLQHARSSTLDAAQLLVHLVRAVDRNIQLGRATQIGQSQTACGNADEKRQEMKRDS